MNLIIYLTALMLTTILKCVHSMNLRGVTIESPPFVMKVNDNHFEGYAVDLINELAKRENFNYTLYTSPDNKYGTVDASGRPNGMINEIFLKRADFAVADLTKSTLRERYAYFTEPFMNLDLTALINKKYKGNISTFEELLYQQEVSYGTLREGETYRFMSMSGDPTILGLQRFISRNAYLKVNSRQEGIEKAINSKYAFIQESVANEYAMDQNCELTVIDDEKEYYPREYGIAVNLENRKLLTTLNRGIQKLKRDGTLDHLKRKYWNRHCMSGAINVRFDVITSISLVVSALMSYLIIN